MQRGEGRTRERPGQNSSSNHFVDSFAIGRPGGRKFLAAVTLGIVLALTSQLPGQETGAAGGERGAFGDILGDSSDASAANTARSGSDGKNANASANANAPAPAGRLRVRDLKGRRTSASGEGLAGGESGEPEAAESGFFGRYLQVLAWMAGILAAAAGVFFLVKKVNAYGRALRPANRFLEVVTRTAVGPKHSLAIVRAGNRLFLLGFAPESIQNLGEINEPSAVVQATRGSNFQERLSEANGDESLLKESNGAEADWVAPYRREVDRLKGMLSQWRATGAHAAGGDA